MNWVAQSRADCIVMTNELGRDDWVTGWGVSQEIRYGIIRAVGAGQFKFARRIVWFLKNYPALALPVPRRAVAG